MCKTCKKHKMKMEKMKMKKMKTKTAMKKTTGMKKKTKRKPNKYALYLKKRYPDLKKKNPNAKVTDISKIVAKEWNAMKKNV